MIRSRMSLGDVDSGEVGPPWMRGDLAVERGRILCGAGIPSEVPDPRRTSVLLENGLGRALPLSTATPLLCRLAQ